MEVINAIATNRNLLVIEDAAQAGLSLIPNSNSKFQTPKAGNLSDAAVLVSTWEKSGALGDGGAITTNDSELAKVASALRNYGSETKYHNDYAGVNSRLDELQAAFLNVKLPYLEIENDKRRSIARRYLSEIKNDKIILPLWIYRIIMFFICLLFEQTTDRNYKTIY
jgi:dTDP-4-amino-4,6-dideoxygalactose transaminase